jgi:hypothetical protein
MANSSKGIVMVPHIINCLAPVDGTTSANSSGYIHMADNLWVTVLVSFGAVSAVTTAIRIWQSSAAATDSRATVPFYYRKQLAGTDAMGAVTAVSGQGTLTTELLDCSSLDLAGYMYIIDVDPADMTDGMQYISVVSTGDAGNSLISMAALVQPRYAQAVPVASC